MDQKWPAIYIHILARVRSRYCVRLCIRTRIGLCIRTRLYPSHVRPKPMMSCLPPHLALWLRLPDWWCVPMPLNL